MQDPVILIKQLIDKAFNAGESGDKKNANRYLKAIYDITIEYPNILWHDREVYRLGKAFLIMYHFDIFEEEEINIGLAHLALFFTQRGIEVLLKGEESALDDKNVHLFEALKNEIVIFKSCEDCFVHSISQFYRPKGDEKQDTYSVSLQLANRVLPYIQYDLLLKFEERFGSFEDDEFLEETCNDIEMRHDSISEKLLLEAVNIQKLVQHYIADKVVNNDFEF